MKFSELMKVVESRLEDAIKVLTGRDDLKFWIRGAGCSEDRMELTVEFEVEDRPDESMAWTFKAEELAR